MKNKLLASLLALSMTMTMLPATALADGEEDTTPPGLEEQQPDEAAGDTGDNDTDAGDDGETGKDDSENTEDGEDAGKDDSENTEDGKDDAGKGDENGENTGDAVSVTFPVNEGSHYEALVESIPESLLAESAAVNIPAAAGESNVSYITVTLPASVVEALYREGNPAAANIQTDLGTVKLSGEAIAALRLQLPGKEAVELTIRMDADAVRMARGLVSQAEAYAVEVADMDLTGLAEALVFTLHTEIAGPAVFAVKADGTYEAVESVSLNDLVQFSGQPATFVLVPKAEAENMTPATTPDENPDEKPDEKPDETPDEKPEQPVILPFTDVAQSAWYHDEVQYVYGKNMMRGDGSETIFNPNGSTTRAMIVTILYRLEGEPAAGVTAFTDVKAGAWYASAVAWAAANGIVNGRSSTEFAPNDPITRQEMAAILYRYAGSFKGYDVTARADLSSYPDASGISAYAREAMSWANAMELITGSNGALLPASSAIRAQVAAILMRFCENIGK